MLKVDEYNGYDGFSGKDSQNRIFQHRIDVLRNLQHVLENSIIKVDKNLVFLSQNYIQIYTN